MSLLFSALYVKWPYDLVLYIQSSSLFSALYAQVLHAARFLQFVKVQEEARPLPPPLAQIAWSPLTPHVAPSSSRVSWAERILCQVCFR